MHQVEHEKQTVGLHRCEILPVADYHLRDPNLSRSAQRLVQKRVRFLPALLRLEEIRFVEKFRIDLAQIDEVGDVDRMGRLDPHLGKIIFFQDDITSALIFKPFHDLVGGDFLLIGVGYLLIPNRTQVGGPELPKTELLFPSRWINGYWNINETKA